MNKREPLLADANPGGTDSQYVDGKIQRPLGRPHALGTLEITEIWILTAAWLSGAGWILSAVGHLDKAGYAIMGVLWLAFIAWWVKGRNWSFSLRLLSWKQVIRPGQLRIFRGIYLLAMAGSLIGGLIYLPTNYDALTYRLPQSLHWLAAGKWVWLETFDNRINFAPPGQTWLFTPLLLFTGSLRPLFLPNLLSFVLLPGLLFFFLRNCGVPRKIAAHWMYIFPCAYGLLLPAGGIGNDLLGAVYILASLCLAFRAQTSGRVQDIWLALLAAALATGVKTVNLPLMAPVVVALWPARGLLRRNWAGTGAVILAAALVSFLPTAAFNQYHTGDWSGDPQNEHKMKMRSPVHAVIGNTMIVGLSNLQPPINPLVGKTNELLSRVENHPSLERTRHFFPRFQLRAQELPIEEAAALGLGITGLLLVGVFSGLFTGRRYAALISRNQALTGLAGLISFAAIMALVGSEGTGRHLMACYALLLPLLLWFGSTVLLRQRWWRSLATICAGSVLIPLLLSPARPLFPAQQVFSALAEKWPGNHLFKRSRSVYEVYTTRATVLDSLERFIPADERVVGFLGSDQPEVSLWFPYGKRQVIHITPTRLAMLREQGIKTVIASKRGMSDLFDYSPEKFLAAVHGQKVAVRPLTIKVVAGPEEWYVINLPDMYRKE